MCVTSLVTSTSTTSTHIANEVGRRANDWNGADISLNVMLRLEAHILRITTLSSRGTTFASQADILMIANGILRKPVQNFMLTSTQSLDPFTHEFHHFALNLRITVMEVWMETIIGHHYWKA